MQVIKRNGRREAVEFDKITRRIRKCMLIEPKIHLDPIPITQKIAQGLFDGIKTKDIDVLVAETAAYMSTMNPDYNILAARVAISNLHKETEATFSKAMFRGSEMLNERFLGLVKKYAYILDEVVDCRKDYDFDYFAFKTLEKSYLLRAHGVIFERIQYMFMRVALSIHQEDLSSVIQTYHDLSEKYYIFATPTLFNAGTKNQQLSSCFLVNMKEDSIFGIYETLKQCALISKNAGGIGISIHKIRAKNSEIKGTGGVSNGIVPMLRVFNDTARYVDQCFTGDSYVYTYQGWTKIEEVAKNYNLYYVLTRDGSFQRILNAHEFVYNGKLMKVKSIDVITNKILEVRVTPHHPVLVHTGTRRPSYIEAHQLTTDTTIFCPWGQLVKILSVTEEDVQGQRVYDFEIRNNHNYFTPIGIVHNGGGKRKGAFAIYLEPWHADILDFLELKKNHGKEELRARDLFYALWVPDLFMKRVEKDESWSLFCPNECPGLHETYGEEFERLYEMYEKQGKARAKIRAQDLWKNILMAQIETGTPYMLYKDTCNRRSNQKNLGTIQGSNLCAEIIEYSSQEEIAVCNLASLSLPKYVEDRKFNFSKFSDAVQRVVQSLNKIIDINEYPVTEAKKSNLKNRPIGIGVQGLADVFFKIGIPFTCDAARTLHREIFETLYYSALSASYELALQEGPYESFRGSPLSQGLFHFDLCGPIHFDLKLKDAWDKLREKIKQTGVRNSLLIALMPTASTSQILGNFESFEPISSNIFTRRTLSGEFIVINKYLVEDLKRLDLWNEDIKNLIVFHEGSIQNIDKIPIHIKQIYKTVWEIKQREILEMAVDRGFFVDQSQSLNVYMTDPNYAKLTSLHFFAWKRGLKTGMYYLRTKSAAHAIPFTIPVLCKREKGCISCQS